MPSTYEGKWGRISYTLRAQLTQSIWRVYKAKTEFPFVTNSEFPFASKAEMIIIGLKVAEVSLSIPVATSLFLASITVRECVCVCLEGTIYYQDIVLWLCKGYSECYCRENGSEAR